MVPFLGVNLSDLTFTEDGNESYVAEIESSLSAQPLGSPRSKSVTSIDVMQQTLDKNTEIIPLKLVNFEKFKLISQLLNTLQTLQKAPKYSFPKIDRVQDWLLNNFIPYEEADLFTLSKQCEPRVNPSTT